MLSDERLSDKALAAWVDHGKDECYAAYCMARELITLRESHENAITEERRLRAEHQKEFGRAEALQMQVYAYAAHHKHYHAGCNIAGPQVPPSERRPPDVYQCAVCGKSKHVDQMMTVHGRSEDLVCSDQCAHDWHNQEPPHAD